MSHKELDRQNEGKTTNPITNLDCLKHSIVKEIFLNTADNSYAIARWSFLNGMYLEFYWNALHAIEKYFKAALLLNGKSSIRDDQGNSFGHDIRLLLVAVEQIFSLNSDVLMSRPDRCGVYWIDEKLKNFVERLYDSGEPNNRYNLYGFSQRADDLTKLDGLVFKVRNIAQYLDGYAFLGTHEKNKGENLSVRDLLERSPSSLYNFKGSKLADLAEPKYAVIINNAILDQNLYFAPENYEHPSFSVGHSSASSIFYRRIGVHLKNEVYRCGAEDLDLIDWVLLNIYLPKKLKSEIQEARAKISAKLQGVS